MQIIYNIIIYSFNELFNDSSIYYILKFMYRYLNMCYCYNTVDFYITNRENNLWLMFVLFTQKNDFK